MLPTKDYSVSKPSKATRKLVFDSDTEEEELESGTVDMSASTSKVYKGKEPEKTQKGDVKPSRKFISINRSAPIDIILKQTGRAGPSPPPLPKKIKKTKSKQK